MQDTSKEFLQLRADLAVVDNKFAETAALVSLAAKYGVKKAGRTRLINDLSKTISGQLRALVEAAKNA